MMKHQNKILPICISPPRAATQWATALRNINNPCLWFLCERSNDALAVIHVLGRCARLCLYAFESKAIAGIVLAANLQDMKEVADLPGSMEGIAMQVFLSYYFAQRPSLQGIPHLVHQKICSKIYGLHSGIICL